MLSVIYVLHQLYIIQYVLMFIILFLQFRLLQKKKKIIFFPKCIFYNTQLFVLLKYKRYNINISFHVHSSTFSRSNN